MSQYHRLLLIADGQMRHSPALQRAAALAQACGATLHILVLLEPVTALTLLAPSIQEQTREYYLQAQRAWLKDEAGLLRSKGLQVTTEVLWSKQPLQDILQQAQAQRAELLIKDLQHEPALKRAFITPLDWHLLRECPLPLHLVSAHGQPLLRKVLAAVDCSQQDTDEGASLSLNERIIQAASALALHCNAELHLVHSYDPSPLYLAEAGSATALCADLLDELHSAQESAFSALAERHGVALECRHFIIGQPIRALADFAAYHQVDVLVLGRVQRKGLDKLIGSTTEHLLYRAPCSILAIAL